MKYFLTKVLLSFWVIPNWFYRFCSQNGYLNSKLMLRWNGHFNPRPAGPLDFPPSAAAWGGRLNAHLMISAPGRRRKKQKAAFERALEKSFWNHFGHFLAQVKIDVTRGQNSKIFQNGFSTIKSLILKVEQRIWHHRVCLVKARRTIYKMTLKEQGQSLTSG